MPRLGTRKLHYLLQQNQPDYLGNIGRDWLFRFLRKHGLLIRPKKKYVQTTNSRHWMKKYPNLVKYSKPSRPEQIWVADITFLTTKEGHRYLHLLTDAYSKKIVGYELSRDLSANNTVKALKNALMHRQYDLPLIHHSDRGLQYCSTAYTEVLKNAKMAISMTQDGSPYDNAVAERINGILKQEYSLDEMIENEKTLHLMVDQAINSYNNYRPHWSCHLLTPQQMHQQCDMSMRSWSKKTRQNLETNNPSTVQ